MLQFTQNSEFELRAPAEKSYNSDNTQFRIKNLQQESVFKITKILTPFQ